MKNELDYSVENLKNSGEKTLDALKDTVEKTSKNIKNAVNKKVDSFKYTITHASKEVKSSMRNGHDRAEEIKKDLGDGFSDMAHVVQRTSEDVAVTIEKK
jgi:gas vesicle protein